MEGVLVPLLAATGVILLLVAVRSPTRGGVGFLVASPRTAGTDSSAAGSLRMLRRVGILWPGAPRAEPRLAAVGWLIGPEEWRGLAVVVGGAAAIPSILGRWPVPLLAPALALAGSRVPGFALAGAERKRRAAIDAEIPQFLDVLAAASSAGLSAPIAVRRAADAVRGPLRVELDRVNRSVDLGARWREELDGLAARCELPDLRRAVAALTRTETLGSSLADTTAELAASVRDARRARATERARTAPVKMLFPLVFLILPAFLLLTVVPVLLTTLQSIR